ncbi:MAG TPA: GNAT family N-acetyltransferase [Candidatus Merdivicinus faecavium]|nr:GNAT family N-acetyltransferase [Candidatus Merdivicinus faecavium]
MQSVEFLKIREHPELAGRAADWFHQKWSVPLEAYQESIAACLQKAAAVPQWYLALEGGRIIGGLGVIENDFHDRPDLTPNVCAVYVEEDCRCRGIAGELLGLACSDMAALGADTLYLLTDHDSFYERYGWEFFCMVRGDGEEQLSRMYRRRTK